MRRSVGTAGPRGADRGSLTLLLAMLMASLLALVGLIIDGGRKLDESATATAIAQEAARAGAGMVDRATAYRSGTFQVNPAQAAAAARVYLAAAGYHGSVSITGTEQIRVTVTVTRPTVLLSLVGVDSITSTGTAVASLVAGVTGPGS
jgi:Flp pilus assembly protein TadG